MPLRFVKSGGYAFTIEDVVTTMTKPRGCRMKTGVRWRTSGFCRVGRGKKDSVSV